MGIFANFFLIVVKKTVFGHFDHLFDLGLSRGGAPEAPHGAQSFIYRSLQLKNSGKPNRRPTAIFGLPQCGIAKLKLSSDAIKPRHRPVPSSTPQLFGLSLILTHELIFSDPADPTHNLQSTSAKYVSDSSRSKDSSSYNNLLSRRAAGRDDSQDAGSTKSQPGHVSQIRQKLVTSSYHAHSLGLLVIL